MITFDDIAQKLRNAGITPSVHRIKIMEHLMVRQGHPTAEQVFSSLQTQGLSVSKATVYNTLTLFLEKGIVRILNTEENENRFDIITHDHGHFFCESCGDIIDFAAEPDEISCEDLKGFVITQKDVYFKGVCPKCLKKNK